MAIFLWPPSIFLPGSQSWKSPYSKPKYSSLREEPPRRRSLSDVPQRLESVADGIREVFVCWDAEVLAAITWPDSKDFDLATYERKNVVSSAVSPRSQTPHRGVQVQVCKFPVTLLTLHLPCRKPCGWEGKRGERLVSRALVANHTLDPFISLSRRKVSVWPSHDKTLDSLMAEGFHLNR